MKRNPRLFSDDIFFTDPLIETWNQHQSANNCSDCDNPQYLFHNSVNPGSLNIFMSSSQCSGTSKLAG